MEVVPLLRAIGAVLSTAAVAAVAQGAPPPSKGFHVVEPPPLLEQETEVCGISADGSAILGYAYGAAGRRAIKWTSVGTSKTGDISWTTYRTAGGMPLFDEKGNPSDAVGLPLKSWRWTKSVGVLDAPSIPSGSFGAIWVWCASADGSVFAGTGTGKQGTEAFRWTQGADPVGLGDLKGGGFYSQANGISADGGAVVGMSRSFDGPQAFLWTKADGMVGLGMLPGKCRSTEAFCVSLDAKTVGGTALTDAGVQAIVWTKADGLSLLTKYLTKKGVSVPAGWELEEAVCVSDDGKVIAGNGLAPDGKKRGWLVVLPAS